MDTAALLHNLDLFSLLALCFAFAGIIAYATWPGMQSRFDAAARLPLDED